MCAVMQRTIYMQYTVYPFIYLSSGLESKLAYIRFQYVHGKRTLTGMYMRALILGNIYISTWFLCLSVAFYRP